MKWRINLILIFLVLFGATIAGRLFYLQVIQRDFYGALAKGQQKFFSDISGIRGKIFLTDKDGNLYTVASDKDWPLVYASPAEIDSLQKEEIAQTLAETLGLDENFILEKLRKDNLYELIEKKLSDDQASKIKSLSLPGIHLGREKIRYYPLNNIASNVVGFVGGEGRGQYGVEGYWDSVLRGEGGFLEGLKSSWGQLLSFSSASEKGDGYNLLLTIDYNIQYFAEKLLKEAKDNLDIEGGQIVVADPNTGGIVAMANYPSYDPNSYSEINNLEIFQNGAIQKIFEPGSVFKAVTMAAALDKNKITPQTTYVDTGRVQVGGRYVVNYDDRIWGEKTMTEVLEKSINTGAVFAESRMGHDIFLDYIKNFGIFEPTGIDLQGEVFSQNQSLKKGYEINFVTASFGQGIELTPIQLVMAYSTIANGGKLIKPHIVENVFRGDFQNSEALTGDNSGGNITGNKDRSLSDNSVIAPKTASQLTAMLVSVIENGYAKKAKIPGYYIAGKTGTAQVAYSALGINKSGYSDKTVQSFIGFAPAFSPRFVVLVKLNNPEAKTAEYSAMPLFRELAKYIIDYWQIPPDYES